VRQFLDIGSGLPASPGHSAGARALWLATHDAARSVVPDAVVAYVDYDPVAVQHSRDLLAGGSPQVVAVTGDVRDPEAILADEEIRAAGFRLDEPACVILACILHFLHAPTAQGVAHSLVRVRRPRADPARPGGRRVLARRAPRADPGRGHLDDPGRRRPQASVSGGQRRAAESGGRSPPGPPPDVPGAAGRPELSRGERYPNMRDFPVTAGVNDRSIMLNAVSRSHGPGDSTSRMMAGMLYSPIV
jgi:S-adenosyl methyltransferase